jgi:hypothetical protein
MARSGAERAAVRASRVRHPIDLPEGYHTAPRAQAWHDRRRLARSLRPGCRAVGLRQVDGMPHEPRTWGRGGPAGAPALPLQSVGKRPRTTGDSPVRPPALVTAHNGRRRAPSAVVDLDSQGYWFGVYECCRRTGGAGAIPERTAYSRPARADTRRQEGPAQAAQGNTGRSSRSRRVRLHTEALTGAPDTLST